MSSRTQSGKRFHCPRRCPAFAAMLVMAITATAHAELYGFRQMQNGSPINGVTVLVSEAGTNPTNGNGLVHFTFRNIAGSNTTKVTNIWFDDRCSPIPLGALLTFDSIINGPGVNFVFGAHPANPNNSNGVCPPFSTSLNFSAGLTGGASSAINQGEYLTLVFTLEAGWDFSDLISCIESQHEDSNPALCVPGLRIAVDAGMASGGGVAGVNNPLSISFDDCNGNGIPDQCDISCSNTVPGIGSCTFFPHCGESSDNNENGIPDECEPGSCCHPDGMCAVTREAACTNGTWTIDGTCTPNTCAQPDAACCFADGSCVMETHAACTLAGGTPGTYGSTCMPNTCQQPTGSCCQPDGTCAVTLQMNCTGLWTIFGTCMPNLCQQPTGSCCYPDGSCEVTSQVNCTGTWTMFGTCTPNTCQQPSGSCCYPNGSCEVTFQVDCTGTWTMFGTCVPNTCQQPTGSCCYPDGSCAVTLKTDCSATWTMFATCEPNTCELPTGSCCYSDGNCAVTLADDCEGTWTMFGTCDPNLCQQPTGSCCNEDGSCAVTLQADCTGTWTMFGTCDPNLCEQPTGSCCHPDGSCAVTFQADCTGTWTMFGTCDPNLCEQPTGSCCYPNGSCEVTFQVDCTGIWTMFGTCDPNLCEQPTGSCCYPNESCEVTFQVDCTGTWTMFGTCVPNTCQQPTGSCCNADGSCVVTLQADCTGTWTMFGRCDPNLCQQPDINCEDLTGFDFGPVLVGACGQEHAWTVTNEGTTGTLTGTITLTGTNAGEFVFTQGGGDFSLAAGASRTVGVRFCPAVGGSKSAALSIISNDLDEGLCNLSLSGIGVHAARDLSQPGPTYCSGSGKPVYINLSLPPWAAALGTEDQPPTGWTVSGISDAGRWDATNHKVKWGPFFAPNFPTQVSYTVTPPTGTTGSHCFSGAISIDGVNEPIYGDSCVSGPSYLPADAPQPPCAGCSDCSCGTCEDGRVVMCEMTGYACAWKRGCNDNLAAMTRAAYIWMEGECYCWDNVQQQWSPSMCLSPASICCAGRGGVEGPRSGTAARQLPAHAPPQTWFTVQIDLAPSAEVMAVGLEDQPPAGWLVQSISDGGAWDEVHGKVKWGPFFVGQIPAYVSYESQPPEGASGAYCFGGEVSFDGWNQSVTGDLCALAAPWSKGDVNCDGAVNASDVGPFVLALLDPSGHASQYTNCNIALADMDDSGKADGADIRPFVNALLNQ